ncbi:hypothetical protein ACFWBR_07200 [Streptomyces sp. NPDC060006]|uniref:hypothetical protein n=1 Tax=unclassified Streptomyces TaxID=2593676 RepID=UPI003682BBAA
METFVTVVVLLAMVALGAFLIHQLNNQHADRIADFPYGRSWPTSREPAPSEPRKVRGRSVASGTGDRRDPRDEGRGRLRSRRPARTRES